DGTAPAPQGGAGGREDPTAQRRGAARRDDPADHGRGVGELALSRLAAEKMVSDTLFSSAARGVFQLDRPKKGCLTPFFPRHFPPPPRLPFRTFCYEDR